MTVRRQTALVPRAILSAECRRTRQDLVGDHRRLGEPLAAVHDAMRDDADFSGTADHAGFLRCQLAEHRFERLGETLLRRRLRRACALRQFVCPLAVGAIHT
jgi:hypothetical protein